MGESSQLWQQHDERIKQLMEQVGMPNSMSLYQAFKQFANEFTPDRSCTGDMGPTYTHEQVRHMLDDISTDARRFGLEVVDHLNGHLGLRERAPSCIAGLDAGGEASKAAQDVLAERARQINVEGWDSAHDDEHDQGDMAMAAACYAIHAAGCYAWGEASYQNASPHHGDPAVQDTLWPWTYEWWKPKNPRRDLVRAAALLLAEIERMDRATPGTEGNANG